MPENKVCRIIHGICDGAKVACDRISGNDNNKK
jgi:hypothetical protein